MLTWAAGEADIVSIVPAAAAGGGLRISGLTIEALQRRIGWVREAAGARFDDLTINILLFEIIVTDDPRSAARKWLQAEDWVRDKELSEDELLASPYLAFGTHEQVAEHLREVIATTGVSYLTVMPHMLESFGPILERLKS
jgi:alkanesulfonate monooxygenase SsuD/methylene tetrahydromethanopterin reductase-like flavin-dependent oxidoreductase (luciferase family)